ncbi:MAG: twin-arginine translocation signal domain-containing protein [Sphingobacteriales bacterium]|nr:MAG: twin-arginine translocation signal domain-containing protein [Sphingobacteriales bacterium]
MHSRRDFIKKAGIGAALAAAGGFPYESFAGERLRKLTILHTNDVHSRLEAFPDDGGKLAGLGGVAARASLIKKIRSEEEHVLLLDAGDMWQGTPYFNLYKGEPETKAMSAMGYDACTMGNHDFDAGIEGFARQGVHRDFSVVISNYDFNDTPLEGKTHRYKIVKKGGLRIGIFGLGVELDGLVSEIAYGNTKYLDPLPVARDISERLKKKENCDLVICLSHLGYDYTTNKVSDKIIAKETEYVDLIIGGHTHTFLDRPEVVANKKGEKIIINQVGWGGVKLGRIDFEFSHKKSSKFFNAQSVIAAKQTIG